MVVLWMHTGHGPHLWYCSYFFGHYGVQLDFFGDGRVVNDVDVKHLLAGGTNE